MIKVYTTDSCPWCVKAKDYLNSKNVKFEELNVQSDMIAREEMIKKTRQMSVPVISVNDTIIIGFDKNALDSALKDLNN